MHRFACLALACTATTMLTAARVPAITAFHGSPGSMAVMSVAVTDSCRVPAVGVSALGVWVDGRYDHELLLFPGSGLDRYNTLLGPLSGGRHEVELRASSYWKAVSCVTTGRLEGTVVEPGHHQYQVLAHAPVLELRADTVGEQTDVPLYEYVERLGDAGETHLRYTVVFSNEDGGTQTRALYARWGRTVDIEQVYDAWLRSGQVAREEFQGPDHEIRAFKGRRRGAAPVLLVATMNNMVTDRGRGIASVRPVPESVDLSRATRESTLDTRPWACRVMARELAAEGHVSADAPLDDRWLRAAPDPRDHIYLEANLTLDHAVAAAWVRDREGRRYWSHYERDSLTISRSGWVRTAVAVGPGPGARIAEAGWSCLAAPTVTTGGSCTIEATRAFAFGSDWVPGANLAAPVTLRLQAGQEASLAQAVK